MTDKRDNNNQIDPALMDTQRLLLGVDPAAEELFDLEEILAEFGDKGAPPAPREPAAPEAEGKEEPPEEPPPPAPPEPEKEERAEERPRRGSLFSRLRRPERAEEPPDGPTAEEEKPAGGRPEPSEPLPAPPEPEPAEEPAAPEDEFSEDLLDMAFWEDLGLEGEALSGLTPEQQTPAPQEVPPPAAPAEPPPSPDPAPEPEEPAPISMEDVVANTVDAVKEEAHQRQEKARRRERIVKRREPSPQHPLPEVENEPPAGETASRHKRRLRECRRSLTLAAPVVVGLWLPWVLEQFGVKTPFFSDSADNAALCVLIPQALASILCWPVYRAAVEGVRDRAWTVYATALLATVVTLLDEMTMLLLPERSGVPPLGGIAAALTLFAQWGLTNYHRGMSETFRTAAMGEPGRVADRCEQGVAKGAGGRAGFFTRASMEDTASQWQRLLLPLLALASLVFAVLSSLGQGRSQDFLWCWSVVLCAGSSLIFPLAYLVPFGRTARRLARSGAAVAGQYGAARLASSRRLVATDGDLFPPGAAVLAGIKLYGEERNRAVSYAATLAVQGGGTLGRVFSDVCRSRRIAYQPLEHFHIHDDNGLSGMVHGETVLVGTPAFMRRKAVRVPANLPSRTAVCLAVDGTLTAVFAIKYNAADTVDAAVRAMKRNGLQLNLAVRDGNVTAKLLKAKFGTDCGAQRPELSERLALSDPEREAEGPSGLLYREGLLPFVTLAVASRRLCQTVAVGNLLSIFSSIVGALLGFYLTFTNSYEVLTPVLLLTYLLLWVAPMLPLVWTVDKL